MEINTERWGLDEQYRFIPYLIPEICIFPQVVEYDILQYLIDIGFACIVLTPTYNGKLHLTILNNRYLLDHYSKLGITPISKEQKRAIIERHRLERIDDSET